MTPRRLTTGIVFSLLLVLVTATPALARPGIVAPDAPLGVSLNYSPSVIQLNSPTTGSYSISGGTAPFTITVTGAPNGCEPNPSTFTTSNASDTFTCTPTATGTFHINVNVQDNVGNTGSASATLTVNGQSGGTGGTGGNNTGGIDLSFLNNLLPIIMITGILFLGSTVAIAVSAVALAILVPRRLKQIRKALEGQPMKTPKPSKTETSAVPPPPPKEQPPTEEL